MKSELKMSVMILMSIFFGSGSQGQADRKPAVAGQFYSADPVMLRADLSTLFAAAVPRQANDVIALISPHAGYVFSGEVAASAYTQLDPDKKYDNVFILASSHRMSFEGASVYNKGGYITPLGTMEVNLGLANKLISENPVFSSQTEPHVHEHSLEVQLPFLQYYLKNEFKIIPIILGTKSASVAEKIAKALKPYLGGNNLFVISTDFSHYPDYEDACRVDKVTADAILLNSPAELLKTLDENEEKEIDNLVTSLCGWTSVLTLLYMTENNNDMRLREIQYRNSGDSRLYGDKDRVVGYHAIVVEQVSKEYADDSFSLNEAEKESLLAIARETIVSYVIYGKMPDIDESKLSTRFKQPFGAFVTLKKDGQLRGCIGRFEATQPLYEVVIQMAVASSTQDSRFPAVEVEEINELVIEISVLTPMRKIQSIDEFELGKHGIYMKKGYSSGTFLPQVARETGWNTDEFFGHCARDKAHIGWDGWKTAELYVYEAYVFGEDDRD